MRKDVDDKPLPIAVMLAVNDGNYLSDSRCTAGAGREKSTTKWSPSNSVMRPVRSVRTCTPCGLRHRR
jgi:hypothetical protein